VKLSESYGMSLTTWTHTVLPVSLHNRLGCVYVCEYVYMYSCSTWWLHKKRNSAVCALANWIFVYAIRYFMDMRNARKS